MHFKARITAVAALFVMAVAVLYGSTREMSAIDEENSLSWFHDKETIHFWYADDTLTDYINSAAVAFGEKEGVRVIPVLCEESQYLEAVNKATLHSDQIPDAFLISNDSLEKAHLAGLAVAVQDAGACTEENYPKAALDAVSCEGSIMAYPLFFETTALVYNKTYLETWAVQQAEKEIAEADSENQETVSENAEESGELDRTEVEKKAQEYMEKAVPSAIDDILMVADTFDVPEQVEGIMKWDVSDIFHNYWFVGEYMVVGGDSGDNREEISIFNSQTIECLEVYQALNQFFSIESDTITYDSVIQDFIDGKIVFTIGTTDVVARLAAAEEDGSLTFEYGIAEIPDVSVGLGSRSLSVTNGVAINGYSQQKELANEFAAFLTGEYAESLYERTGRMAASKSANADQEWVQVFGTEYADSVALPKMIETGHFWLQLEVLFAKVWNGEDATVLIQELSDAVNQQLSNADA